MKKIKVAPSILSADFRVLEREVKAAQDAGADMIHCDVMDGHFVPNITFGPFVVEAVKKCVAIPLDVHLMISDPGKYADAFCDAGADILSFHAEAVGGIDDVFALVGKIRARGARPGVAVNPDKPVSLFMGALTEIDQIVIMSVYAGFGGQKFIPDAIDKVAAVRKAALDMGVGIDIEVDGGVNEQTARLCVAAGADVLVAGSYVFGGGAENYAGRIEAVRGK
ncbi:MAG: ribulose-phosphate 3-epimerase [Chitinispirillales bacterium]|jgi:ribulose-phosphate 3-epimerase|nr:ribulose-phosphate 3-epimerase [Chitinispirillales bacterium]